MKLKNIPVLAGIAFMAAFYACQPARTREDNLNKRLVELESEFWNPNATSQVLLNRLQSHSTQVVWSTNFHTAAPVPLGAVGPSAYTSKLKGIVHNDSVGRVLKEAVAHRLNVILVIGDGMGNMHMALPVYKRYAEKDETPTMFERIMSEGTCGYVYTCTSDGLVTGSAASGTALATGSKTRMNMVGVDRDGQKLESSLALAKSLNYKTALVSDAGITDATPAVFYAHSVDRDLESDIAAQLAACNQVDVILGGGGSQFIPQGTKLTDFFPGQEQNNFASSRKDSLNLLAQFQSNNYQLCFNLKQLQEAPANQKLVGFFGGGGLPAVIDRGEHTAQIPMLEDMAGKALELVSNSDSPYFTMIECARIDWEAHDNDIAAVFRAVEDMNRVLELAYAYYRRDPENTLLVFTSDHETGGLEIAYRKMPQADEEQLALPSGETWKNITNPLSFQKYSSMLTSQKKSVSGILSESKTVDLLQKNLQEYMGISISDEDAALILESQNRYKRYKYE